jgi:putative ABC transport system permease protein
VPIILPVRPILASLRRHKSALLLIVMEITFACAILSNAVFAISQRLARIALPSGLAEAGLVMIEAARAAPREGADPQTDQGSKAAQLAMLAALPGVRSAAMISDLPLDGDGFDLTLALNADGSGAKAVVEPYQGSPGIVSTLGLHLLAGRDFLPDEYADRVTSGLANATSAIITADLARRLWSDGSAIGKTFYINGPIIVVGVVDHLLRGELTDIHLIDNSVLLPLEPIQQMPRNYLLRVTPGDEDRVRKAAVAALHAMDSRIIVDQQRSYAQIRDSYFRQDRAMAGLLVSVSIALLLVTALGVFGLASFWVESRRRAIGIRRALGATRGDILQYFQLENFLIVGAGVVLGVAAAYALNLWLMQRFELPRLPLLYAPAGAFVLCLLGQLAVLSPALRASRVPPVVATRSV